MAILKGAFSETDQSWLSMQGRGRTTMAEAGLTPGERIHLSVDVGNGPTYQEEEVRRYLDSLDPIESEIISSSNILIHGSGLNGANIALELARGIQSTTGQINSTWVLTGAGSHDLAINLSLVAQREEYQERGFKQHVEVLEVSGGDQDLLELQGVVEPGTLRIIKIVEDIEVEKFNKVCDAIGIDLVVDSLDPIGDERYGSVFHLAAQNNSPLISTFDVFNKYQVTAVPNPAHDAESYLEQSYEVQRQEQLKLKTDTLPTTVRVAGAVASAKAIEMILDKYGQTPPEFRIANIDGGMGFKNFSGIEGFEDSLPTRLPENGRNNVIGLPNLRAKTELKRQQLLMENSRLKFSALPVVDEAEMTALGVEIYPIAQGSAIYSVDISKLKERKYKILLNAAKELYIDAFGSDPWNVDFSLRERDPEKYFKEDKQGKLLIMTLDNRSVGGCFIEVGSKDEIHNALKRSLDYDVVPGAASYLSEELHYLINVNTTGLDPAPQKGLIQEIFMASREAIIGYLDEEINANKFFGGLTQLHGNPRGRYISEKSKAYDTYLGNLFSSFANTQSSIHDLYRVIMIAMNVGSLATAVDLSEHGKIDIVHWTIPKSKMGSINRMLCNRINYLLSPLPNNWQLEDGNVVNTREFMRRARIYWEGRLPDSLYDGLDTKIYKFNEVQLASLPADELLKIVSNWNVYKMIIRAEVKPLIKELGLAYLRKLNISQGLKYLTGQILSTSGVDREVIQKTTGMD